MDEVKPEAEKVMDALRERKRVHNTVTVHGHWPLGAVLSLVISLLASAFSGGLLYQRIITLETAVAEITKTEAIREDKLGQVLQVLARIDERLKIGSPIIGRK